MDNYIINLKTSHLLIKIKIINYMFIIIKS